MRKIHTLGIDAAKRVLQLHATDKDDNVVLRRRLSPTDALKFLKKMPPCLIGMEAASGTNNLGQRISAMGHTVRLMPASYVKPYVKTNKNDANDAEAICEAVRRPNMRFVPIKTPEQQSILMLHRTRALLSRQKVSLNNAMKALLAEFGLVVARHSPGTSDALAFTRSAAAKVLPDFARLSLEVLADQWRFTEGKIKECRRIINRIHKLNPDCVRLATIPGIGTLAATALVASIGDGHSFRSGRHLSAWLGLVPKQRSSGERILLGRISKRGDVYLRRLFVMAAMSIMRVGAKSKHQMVHWALRIADQKRHKIGVIALANKLARIAWAVLVKGQQFSANAST